METPALESLFTICWPSSFNNIKKSLQHKCFPVNIPDFLRIAFFIERLRWLILKLLLFVSCVSDSISVRCKFLKTYHIFAVIYLQKFLVPEELF